MAEFFLRGVSFEKERPIMPGNEVSNRTILMSLAACHFEPPLVPNTTTRELGTFNYVGRDVARCSET